MVILHVRHSFPNAAQRDAYYGDLTAAEIISASKAENGCLQYEYFFSADTDNELFLAEIWETEEALEAHHQTPHFKSIPTIAKKYDKTTKVLKYTVVD